MSDTGELVRIGCFTGAEAGPPAVGVHTVDPDGTPRAASAAENPSYLLLHPTLPVLYALGEADRSTLISYRYGDDPDLVELGRVGTEGSGGCHLAFDPTGRFVVVAHYGVGSVSVLAVGDDGVAGPVVDTIAFTGTGPDTDRQEASHAHMAHPDPATGEVLVPDLGADRIHRLRLDDEGRITALDPVVTPPGSGPRHLVVVDDVLVLACELSAELWLARRSPDGWTAIGATASTARTDPPIYPSAIRAITDADGHRVLVANRGPDTFATFALDAPSGTVTLVDETATGGTWPRDLVVHDGRVWIANQNSADVAIFAPDGDGWRLDRQFVHPSPGCIVFTPTR